MASMEDTTTSEVFSVFVSDINSLKALQSLINAVINPTIELHESVLEKFKFIEKYEILKGNEVENMYSYSKRMEARRCVYEGAYISFFVKWEGFVQEFLEEMFHKTFKWYTYPPEATTFQETDHLKRSFQSYSPTLSSISYCFQQLFDCKIDLAGLMVGNGNPPICFNCIRFGFNNFYASDYCGLSIDNVPALETLTRLLYGVRCMLTHLNHKKTFSSESGALYRFPNKEKFFKQMGSNSHPEAVEQFYNLYQRAESVKDTGAINRTRDRQPQIFYSDIINLYRFIIAVARRLHRVMFRLSEKVFNHSPY